MSRNGLAAMPESVPIYQWQNDELADTPVIVWEDGGIKAVPPEQLSHLETLPKLHKKKP